MTYKNVGDDETHTRIQQYELAFRMQHSVPELTELKNEPESTFKLYGEDARAKPGCFAHTALMARRMVERGVRFVQVYLNNWDTHSNVAGRLPSQCKDIDQACYGLVQDLKARGMLDDTLVVWGGEFGRTPFNEKGNGRDHNPWGFSVGMAGGGVQKGKVVGRTDEIGLRAVERPLHVHDIHATILWCLGLDHVKVTYLHNGRSERPTIVSGDVVREALAG